MYVVCEAASSVDTGLVLSTYSTCSLEQLSVAAASDAVLLLQLYVWCGQWLVSVRSTWTVE